MTIQAKSKGSTSMSSGLTKHVLHITTVNLFINVTDGSKFFKVTLGKKNIRLFL